jgi:hypothetical protein
MLRGRHGEGSSSLDSNRRTSLAVGVLFLLTFVTSIAALALFQPVLDTPVGYVAGSGSDNRILFGAFLELLLIIANIGTAVVLFPILRRQNETVAVGWVTASSSNAPFRSFLGAGAGPLAHLRGFRPSPVASHQHRAQSDVPAAAR